MGDASSGSPKEHPLYDLRGRYVRGGHEAQREQHRPGHRHEPERPAEHAHVRVNAHHDDVGDAVGFAEVVDLLAAVAHTVVAGDTLSKIAKAHLGDAGRYMEIFNANTDTLTNPDQIKVGQTLKLPAR